MTVLYDAERLGHLAALRERATALLEVLGRGSVYGSVARGDVHKGSDIDLVVPGPSPAWSVEMPLEGSGETVSHREIIMASPNSAPRAHICLSAGETVSFALLPLKRREEEFYMFGGMLGRGELDRGLRVAGVDKRLLLIEPLPEGHRESAVSGREPEVAAVLGIGRDVVEERARVLRRRDRVGRTGVYLRMTVEAETGFEGALRYLCRKDPAVRRQLRDRGMTPL